MRVRKVILAIVLGVLSVVQAVTFGWAVAADESVPEALVAAFHGIYALYAFALSCIPHFPWSLGRKASIEKDVLQVH